MLVISLKGVNQGIWSHLECFSHQSIFQGAFEDKIK